MWLIIKYLNLQNCYFSEKLILVVTLTNIKSLIDRNSLNIIKVESSKIFKIDKKYTTKLILAIELARKAISELTEMYRKNNKRTYRVEDFYIEVEEKTDIINGIEENVLHFWFYSDEITDWMEGKKGINFSIFFDKNSTEGRIQYYRDSFIEE